MGDVDRVRAVVERLAAAMSDNKSYLTELDQAIGDGDHGINMDRGFQEALGRLGGDPEAPAETLRTTAMALIASVGGAAGPLYGTFFLEASRAVQGAESLDTDDIAALFAAGVDGVRSRGGASPGDKTMVDALQPAAEALEGAAEVGAAPVAALRAAREAAREGMEATVQMVAQKGRASYLGDRSKGHLDPGAASSYLLLDAAVTALEGDD